MNKTLSTNTYKNNTVYLKINSILLFLILLLVSPKYAIAEETTKNTEKKHLTELSDEEILKKGLALLENEDEDNALLCFEILNARKPEDQKIYATSLYKAGRIYYNKTTYSKAMENFMKSLNISEENNYKELLIHLFKDIGNIYSSFNDFERSTPLYKKALKIAREEEQLEFVNKLLSNLISAYTEKTTVAEYWMYYKEMSSNKEDNNRYQYDLLLNKGIIYSYEKNYQQAIKYIKMASEYAIKHKLKPLSVAVAYSHLADLYINNKQIEIGLSYLYKNKEISEQNKAVTLLIPTLKALSEVLQETDRKKALEYKARYLEMSDSILNFKEFKGISNALYYYEMDNKQKAISSLSKTNIENLKEIQAQRNLIIAMAIFSIVFLVLLTILYKQKQKLKNAYQDLFNKSQNELASDKRYIQRIAELESKINLLKQQNKEQLDQISEEANTTNLKTWTKELSTKPNSSSTTSIENNKKEQTIEEEDNVKQPMRLSEEQKRSLLDAILQIMEQTEEYCDSDFSIDKLATLIGSNSKYVSQVINDIYNKNFRTFLNEFRVKKAMIRMNDIENYGNYTIKAIAESVGYKSQSNFINVFTKLTGIKPSVYQKMSREKE